MSNLYAQWRELFAPGPTQAGQVIALDGGVATVQLPGGGILRAKGDTTVGATVFMQDGVILGPAASLPIDSAEV